MKLDLSRTVYSIYGSYLSFNRSIWNEPLGFGIYLCTHTGRGRKAPRDLFLLETTLESDVVETEDVCTPWGLTRSHAGGTVEVCLEGECGFRIRTKGVGAKFRAVPGARILLEARQEGSAIAHAGGCESKFHFEALTGGMEPKVHWELGEGRNRAMRYDQSEIWIQPDSEIRVQQGGTMPRTSVCPSYEEVVADVRKEWEAWLEDAPVSELPDWDAGRAEAAYITWCSVVAPRGLYEHPVMLMNKTCIDQVWSWDHCFNAMACARSRPEVAWAQFMSIADYQDEEGCLPDSVNIHMRNYTFTKPPVHGWAYAWCMEQNPEFFADPDRLRITYDWMSKWSRWWIDCSSGGEGNLPYYLHGNNSGWDNSTIFDVATPTISPDAAAYLSLQCRFLSKAAELLGYSVQAVQWTEQAERLQEALIQTLWKEDHFVGQTLEGRDVECQSLITCMPMILGRWLPEEIQQLLAEKIESFLTEFGLATEHPDSPEFHQHAHAYWRSSVWPPPVMIVVSGLRDAGFDELADTISERYCRATAGCGFRENHDPLTGEGRSDYAFTWTASVSLILASQV